MKLHYNQPPKQHIDILIKKILPQENISVCRYISSLKITTPWKKKRKPMNKLNSIHRK